MKKILKTILILSFIICVNISSYAAILLYDADEYIIKVQNIDDQIEEIRLLNYEECSLPEIGVDYTDTVEEVSLYGEDELPIVTGYDTENYFIKQTVIYDYVYGDAARNPKIRTILGQSMSGTGKNLKSMNFSVDQKFKNEKEFKKECKEAKYYEFRCMRSIVYTAYKISDVKKLDISNIKDGNYTYKHDDLSNLKIGIKIKNINQEEKIFISDENDLGMRRPVNYKEEPDREKIILFDYITGSCRTNTEKPFEKKGDSGIVYLLICFVIAILVVKIEKKIKNKNKNENKNEENREIDNNIKVKKMHKLDKILLIEIICVAFLGGLIDCLAWRSVEYGGFPVFSCASVFVSYALWIVLMIYSFIKYKVKEEKPKYVRWYMYLILPFLHMAFVLVGWLIGAIIGNFI